MISSPDNATVPPRVVRSGSELLAIVRDARAGGQKVGLVPTMGALHAGHASLVDRSAAECDLTVATIFVNPAQFGPGEDFGRYPRTLDADLSLLATHGAAVVFAPSREEMYGAEHSTYVDVQRVSERWEGACRPRHFLGVATVVLKLLNVVGPDVAVFLSVEPPVVVHERQGALSI